MDHKELLIDKIFEIEWLMLSSVNNRGGLARCQEDPDKLAAIRTSHFAVWSTATLESYLGDLEKALLDGRNLMTEKYALMEGMIEPPAPANLPTIDTIVERECRWAEEFRDRYPSVQLQRKIHRRDEVGDEISSETYSRAELQTYSARTLELYHRDNLELEARDQNRIEIAVGQMLRKMRAQTDRDAQGPLH